MCGGAGGVAVVVTVNPKVVNLGKISAHLRLCREIGSLLRPIWDIDHDECDLREIVRMDEEYIHHEVRLI